MIPYGRQGILYLIGIGLTSLLLYSSVSQIPKCSTPPPAKRLVIERPSLCRTASVFRCEQCIPDQSLVPLMKNTVESQASLPWSFEPGRDGRNYKLTGSQCDVAFPGLFENINAMVKQRKGHPVTEEAFSQSHWPNGTMLLMTYDNELYLMDQIGPDRNFVRSASTLQSIYRAVTTSLEPLPNIYFAVSTGDFVQDLDIEVWSYTRTAEDLHIWLMPDFSFWSYGLGNTQAFLGSYTDVRRQMRETDEQYTSFASKIPKAFWRGETAWTETVRDQLISQTEGKYWADIKPALAWNASEQDVVPIQDSCKYMFLIHTEGVAYSSRLKYLLNCRSVIFAHTFEWIEPFQYLMVSSGPKQNFVEVSRDFSDLERKIEYYLEHLDEAERIANNSMHTFRDRYLTPAAETCYWRKLISGWRQSSCDPKTLSSSQAPNALTASAVPFQEYILKQRTIFVPVSPKKMIHG